MAQLLAVSGGLAGLIGVLVAIFVTGLDFVLVIEEENIEVSKTLVGMSWALVGLLGGVMSWGNPRIPGLFMLVSGVAGLITIPIYFVAGGILLLLGAIMALTEKKATLS